MLVKNTIELKTIKTEFKTKLELEYGNLMQQLETTFDWFEKRKIQKKLNAVNCLLDIPYIEESILYATGIDKITSKKSSVSNSIFQGKDYIDLHNNKNKKL